MDSVGCLQVFDWHLDGFSEGISVDVHLILL